VFDLLRQAGMTTVFGNPGSTELPLFRDFPDDFRYVLGLQEAIVVGMADGYAQATNHAAFVNLHSAAGVGNAMGAIFTAYRNRTPLVVTAGQQARSMLPFDPFLAATRATELPQPYVKWACEPARAADVPLAIARAIQVANQAPCGPTFVSIPVDDWDQPAATTPVRVCAGRQPLGVPDVSPLTRALISSRAPVLVVGQELDSAEGWQAAIALAEHYQAAVWAPPMYGRCGFPQSHPLFAGCLPAKPEAILQVLQAHDLIVVLGAPAFTYHVEGQPPFVPAATPLFQITEDASLAAAAIAGESWVGDCVGAIKALLAQAGPAVSISRPAHLRRPATATDRLTAGVLVQAIHELRHPDSLIVEEAPTTRDHIQRHLPIDRPMSYFACSSGGLGFGLAAAVGVALAKDDKQVIAIIGDGSCMYASAALWTAAAFKAPLKIVIVNNGGYAALDRFASHFGMEAAVGTRLDRLDFVALAQAQGVVASRVAAPAALRPALRALFDSNGPALLEVMVTRDSVAMS
jgi:benzoylformate decarboxylase